MLEKSEIEPKTTTDSNEDEIEDVPMGPKLVKDTLGNGVYYKNPDY